MLGVPVCFRLNNTDEDYAFRRLAILPRVGEAVEFLGKTFMVLQLLHEFSLDTDHQRVYLYIEESK